MYESMIKMIAGQIQSEIENDLMVKVSQTVGYEVDKDELIKALQYDRKQYEKGYNDGLKADKWISCKEKMPEEDISILICSYRGTVSKATYNSDMGYFYIADSDLYYNELDITHWQPLPQGPREALIREEANHER